MTISPNQQVTDELLFKLDEFGRETAKAWMDAGLIKKNAFGVVIKFARNGSFESDFELTFSSDENIGENPLKNGDWYASNALGKTLACIATGVDSHEAVRLYQGVLANVESVFPWGGAVIDKVYGIIVGVSGFDEDEDIMFARAIRNFLVMLLDRRGESVLKSARSRGEQADRFTRV